MLGYGLLVVCVSVGVVAGDLRFFHGKISVALRGLRRSGSARRQGSLQARKNTNEQMGPQNELYIGGSRLIAILRLACRNIATSWQATKFSKYVQIMLLMPNFTCHNIATSPYTCRNIATSYCHPPLIAILR